MSNCPGIADAIPRGPKVIYWPSPIVKEQKLYVEVKQQDTGSNLYRVKWSPAEEPEESGPMKHVNSSPCN